MSLEKRPDGVLYISRRTGACRVLGPGLRAVVWFHGCGRKCKGCIASEMNNSREYEAHTAEELGYWVSSCEGIEGVTLSGGEPLDQDIGGLCAFLSLVRKDNRQLSVIVFTGYLLEELLESDKKAVLDYIDVLVDGPYIEELNDNSGLRGSSNQRIHFLTRRHKSEAPDFFGDGCRNVEMELNMDASVSINGIPRKGFMEDFKSEMQNRGYELSFEDRRDTK